MEAEIKSRSCCGPFHLRQNTDEHGSTPLEIEMSADSARIRPQTSEPKNKDKACVMHKSQTSEQNNGDEACALPKSQTSEQNNEDEACAMHKSQTSEQKNEDEACAMPKSQTSEQKNEDEACAMPKSETSEEESETPRTNGEGRAATLVPVIHTGVGSESKLSATPLTPSKSSADEDKHDFFETNQCHSAITVLIENALTLGELFFVLQSRRGSARIFKTARDNTESDWCLYATSGRNVPRTYIHIFSFLDQNHFWVLVGVVAVMIVVLAFATAYGGKRTQAGKLTSVVKR